MPPKRSTFSRSETPAFSRGKSTPVPAKKVARKRLAPPTDPFANLPFELLVLIASHLVTPELKEFSKVSPRFFRATASLRFFVIRSLGLLPLVEKFGLEKIKYVDLANFSPLPSRFAIFEGCARVSPGPKFLSEVVSLEIPSSEIFAPGTDFSQMRLSTLKVSIPTKLSTTLGETFLEILGTDTRHLFIRSRGDVFFPIAAFSSGLQKTVTVSFVADCVHFYRPGEIPGRLTIESLKNLRDAGVVPKNLQTSFRMSSVGLFGRGYSW